MTMDFRKVFKGFKEATPDGKFPKLNSVDPVDMAGDYLLEVVLTDTFDSQESKTTCFRVEFLVHECSNGKLKPGAHCAFIQHNIDSKVDWEQGIAFGNVKNFLAPAMTFMDCDEGIELSPIDDTLDWVEWITQACEHPDFLEGALVRCTVQNMAPGRKSKSGKPWAKCNFSAVEERLKAA